MKKKIAEQLELPLATRRFRVTLSHLAEKTMSRVIVAETAQEAVDIATSLEDDEGWTLDECGIAGTDETLVELEDPTTHSHPGDTHA